MEQVMARAGWILVVDDHPAARYALGRTLRSRGFGVREASSGTEALRLAEEGPDLVLLDIHLPDLSGLEVCRRLRASDRTAALPIVHMSASFTETGDRVRGLESGADAYLTEPIDTAELLATIDTLLEARRAERRARAAEREWSSTFEAIREGLATVAADGTVLRHNTAFARMLCGEERDLLGAQVTELFRARFDDWEGPVRDPQGRTVAEHQAGEETWRCVSDPLTAASEPTRHVLIVEDVTEGRRAEDDRRRLTEALARSNEELQQFAYAVSHDLKEPVRTVSTFAGLLHRRLGDADPETAEILEFVVGGARRMSEMIDGVLSIAQLAGDAPDRVPVALDEILAECVADLLRAVEEAGAEVRVRPMPVLAVDRQQFRQLFQNLLGNALKFRRPEVPCVIEVASERRRKGWLLSVRDNGSGIPPSQLDRVFHYFQRAHTDVPGLGIGLTLARTVVERHGGRIWLQSRVGAGTTALLLVPDP